MNIEELNNRLESLENKKEKLFWETVNLGIEIERTRRLIKEAILEKEREQALKGKEKLLLTPIENLEISVRLSHTLIQGGYRTLKDVCRSKKIDIYRTRNVGKIMLGELERFIYKKGLSFEMTGEELEIKDQD